MSNRSLPALFVAVLLALVVVGCGGGGSSMSSAPSGSTSTAGSTAASTSSTTTSTSTSSTGGGGSAVAGSGSTHGPANANGAPLGANTAKSGDNSIQTYGSSAQGAEKAAILAAMRSFESAVAAGDWPKVCDLVSQRLLAGIEQGDKKCPTTAQAFLGANPITARFARHALGGRVSSVRIGPTTAFILFRPSGAAHTYYLAFRHEGSSWKALGLTTGNPLSPLVPSG